MGLKKIYRTIFHPNRITREAEHAAENARNDNRNKAAQQAALVEEGKKQALLQISANCDESKQELDSWYQDEIKQAADAYEETQANYAASQAEVDNSYSCHLESVESEYNKRKQQLELNQQQQQQELIDCANKANEFIIGKEQQYNNQLNLEHLWGVIKNDLFHQQAVTAYRQLKKNHIQGKNKNYSLLKAYLKQLSEQNLVTSAELNKYNQFIQAVYSSEGIDLIVNRDFQATEIDLLSLFDKNKSQDDHLAYVAYKKDQHQFATGYNKVKSLYHDLSEKIAYDKAALAQQHDQQLNNLSLEKQQKITKLTEHYNKFTTEIADNKQQYQVEYSNYIANIDNKQEQWLKEIEHYKKAQTDKVTEKYNAEIAAINKVLADKLQDINDKLTTVVKKLKKSHDTSIFNGLIGLGAGVAAFFTGGSTLPIAEAATESLVLTSAGAFANLFSDNGKVGLHLRTNLSSLNPDAGVKLAERPDASTIQFNDSQDYHAKNLNELNSKFNQASKNVLAWQEKEEHSLFYTLYKDMPVIKTHDNYSNFSNDYNKNKVDFSLNKYQHDTRQLVSRKPQYQYGNSYSNGERYSILFDSQFTPTWGKNWLDNQLSKLFQGFNPSNNSRTLYLGWQYNQPGETTWLVSLKSNEHSIDYLFKNQFNQPYNSENFEIAANSLAWKSICGAWEWIASKFEATDWRPIDFEPELKSYKAGIDRDNRGQVHYRDLKNGKFSKSPLQQAIEHAKSDKLLPGEIHTSLKPQFDEKNSVNHLKNL